MKINYGTSGIIEFKTEFEEKNVICEQCKFQTIVKNDVIKCYKCGTLYVELQEYTIFIKYKDGSHEKELMLAKSPIDAYDRFSFFGGGIISNSVEIRVYMKYLHLIIDTKNYTISYRDTKYLDELNELNLKFINPYKIIKKNNLWR